MAGEICAFFGHRDAPLVGPLADKMEEVVQGLINRGVAEYWLCSEGLFDNLARITLKQFQQRYRHLYLCYLPARRVAKSKEEWIMENYEIIFPREVEDAPWRLAVVKRNDFIIENADIFVCYVVHNCGGAYEAMHKALKKHKEVINLATLI